MKKAFFAVLQFVLFFFTYAAGSFFPPFHIQRVLASTPGSLRLFIWDGILLSLALFVLILLVEVVRKRLRSAAPITTLALVLALALGFVSKFGFKTLGVY